MTNKPQKAYYQATLKEKSSEILKDRANRATYTMLADKYGVPYGVMREYVMKREGKEHQEKKPVKYQRKTKIISAIDKALRADGKIDTPELIELAKQRMYEALLLKAGSEIHDTYGQGVELSTKEAFDFHIKATQTLSRIVEAEFRINGDNKDDAHINLAVILNNVHSTDNQALDRAKQKAQLKLEELQNNKIIEAKVIKEVKKREEENKEGYDDILNI